jgi:hypothetical protein
MALLKEFRCMAHGFFESMESRCPHGCTITVERAFLTAPGAISKKTSNTDRLLTQLAKDYGLSDMSNKDGTAVAGKRKTNFAPVWGDVPQGNKMEIGKGEVTVPGAAGGAVAAAGAYRVTGAEPVIKDPGTIQGVGKLRPPRPIIDRRLTYGTPADLAAAVRKAA